jgi:hypothetical protein
MSAVKISATASTKKQKIVRRAAPALLTPRATSFLLRERQDHRREMAKSRVHAELRARVEDPIVQVATGGKRAPNKAPAFVPDHRDREIHD